MKILLLGASGFVGKQVKKAVEQAGHEVLGTYCSQDAAYAQDTAFRRLDIAQEGALEALLDEWQPELIISSLRAAFSVQRQAHETIADYLTEKKDGRLIFVSTANVFDADFSHSHTEEEQPDAESEYGLYKAECEAMLCKRLGERLAIIRIPMVWDRECPRIRQLRVAQQSGKRLPMWQGLLVNYATPQQIGAVIAYIIKENRHGVFHVGTDDLMDCYEFYRKIMEALCLHDVAFEMEILPEIQYQAVVTKREGLPQECRLTVEQVLRQCAQTI